MIRELIVKNRTYRRFYEDFKIDKNTLESLVELARLSASGSNLQSLKYILSCEEEKNKKVFDNIKWAGYLKDWNGPEVGERPTAYVVMLCDKEISLNYMWDHGIACQSILLGACEKGFGGCMFGSVDKENLRKALEIPDIYDIVTVIALGKPKETVVIDEIKDLKNVKYWRDENKVHHVPKRKLEDIILDI